MKMYNNIKKQNMNKENNYWKGILVGFAVSTIVWCALWAFVIGKIDNVHKQELDYIIEKHQTSTQHQVQNCSSLINTKQTEIALLNETSKKLNNYTSQKNPRYILRIKLKQSHLSLDIREHLKDAMNAIEFEIPVDKDFYNSVSVGTKITDEFRVGSFVLNGSIGKWNMIIIGKDVR